MGVADNRSYKDEYLFTGRHNSVFRNPDETAKDNPSIEADPKINSTIKENPYRSNVEIEGREVVLQPDLSALFNAVGKRHSKGGMDVLLKPNAFIFSDFEDLKFSKDDHELFELKQGGKKATNTPADVLKRNIDLKHYNGLVNLLGDPFKDDLAKKSSTRMLEKYIGTLGNIAYIQEEKKGMPQGVPDFALDSAPVYDDGLKDTIMENKQYAKAGGTVNNPYAQAGGFARVAEAWNTQNKKQSATAPSVSSLPQTEDEWASWRGDKLDTFQKKYGVTNAAVVGPTLDEYATKLGYPASMPKNIKAFQTWMYSNPEYRKVIDARHTQYGQPLAGKPVDGKFGIRWKEAADEIITPKVPQRDIAKITTPQQEQWPGPTETINPGDVTGKAQGVKRADWKFTPWQKTSHLNDLWNWLDVDKEGAYRSRYNATYINPALVNPEQAVGDAKAGFNQQLDSANVLNPILRNAQSSQAYGQYLNTVPGIRDKYDTTNAGIITQSRQYNNQVKNNETLVNNQNDINYVRDDTTGRVNYKNMKTHLKNTALSNVMSDAALNQKLAYSLLQQNNPAYGFDWDSGNFYRNNKNILDVATGDAKSDMYTELAQTIMGKIKRGQNPTPEEVNFMKSLAVGKLNFSSGSENTPFKKGGRVKNPYK